MSAAYTRKLGSAPHGGRPGDRGRYDRIVGEVHDDAWRTRLPQRIVYDAKVVEGRDGYLFMADDNNEVMAQHSGERRLNDVQLDGWRRVLEERTELLAGRGCAHLVMVVPNNHSVYPEKLPADVESAPERPVHQLMAHLQSVGSAVSIIYPLDELVAAKEKHQICSRVDSHWTDRGAFLAFQKLMEDAGTLVPTRMIDDEDVVFIEAEVDGDLGEKLDPPRKAIQDIARMRNRYARLVYDNCVDGTGAIVLTNCVVAPPTTCLLLGDSYAYFLAPFLSECWRRFALIHAPTLDSGVVDALQPDIAVTMVAERFLVAVPHDPSGPTMKEREQDKRAYERVRPPVLYWMWPSIMSAGPVELMRARLLREERVRDAALVSVIAYAGLRPAEAMALRWSDIDADSIVVQPLPRMEADGAGPRRVPLWRPLAEDLEAWRRESDGDGGRRVFSVPGRPWAVDMRVWRLETYPEVARAAGLDDLAPGTLRNVFCALLISQGCSVEEVAELASITQTEVWETFGWLLNDAKHAEPLPAERAIARARAAVGQ